MRVLNDEFASNVQNLAGIAGMRRVVRLDAKTPILALKEWYKKRPDLFVKRVYDQTDNQAMRLT
jgi:hypothetical protein